MSRRNQVVVPARGEVERTTVLLYRATKRVLEREALHRGLTLSDLVAEALSQRPVDPIPIQPEGR